MRPFIARDVLEAAQCRVEVFHRRSALAASILEMERAKR
jgi:hypothetical protein